MTNYFDYYFFIIADQKGVFISITFHEIIVRPENVKPDQKRL